MTGWWVTSLCPTTSATHTLRLFVFSGTRNSLAISKTCTPNSIDSAVSGTAIAVNEPISPRCLCIDKFRSWRRGQRLVR